MPQKNFNARRMQNKLFELSYYLNVRRGIRTLAQKTGLRPERSALDRSAILTKICNKIGKRQKSKLKTVLFKCQNKLRCWVMTGRCLLWELNSWPLVTCVPTRLVLCHWAKEAWVVDFKVSNYYSSKQNLILHTKNVERFTILRVILAQGPC